MGKFPLQATTFPTFPMPFNTCKAQYYFRYIRKLQVSERSEVISSPPVEVWVVCCGIQYQPHDWFSRRTQSVINLPGYGVAKDFIPQLILPQPPLRRHGVSFFYSAISDGEDRNTQTTTMVLIWKLHQQVAFQLYSKSNIPTGYMLYFKTLQSYTKIPAVHGAMGCSKKKFKLVWRFHKLCPGS